ncbi:MAG: hypothetical protein ACT4TC_16125 [Myxococcaceae bacterium]
MIRDAWGVKPYASAMLTPFTLTGVFGASFPSVGVVFSAVNLPFEARVGEQENGTRRHRRHQGLFSNRVGPLRVAELFE